MRVALAILLMLFATSVAAAQLCAGNTAFGLTHVHIAVNIASDKLAQRYTGELRLGYRRVFAALEYGTKTWEATSLDGESRATALTVGLQIPHAPHAKVELCWLLSYASLSGPDQIGGSYWKYAEHLYAAGVTMGLLAWRTRLWDVTPTAALTVGNSNPKMTTVYGGNLSQFQDFCCGSQTFSALRLGLGLGFSDELTLTPEVAVPLGDVGTKAYGIRVAVRLGKGI